MTAKIVRLGHPVSAPPAADHPRQPSPGPEPDCGDTRQQSERIRVLVDLAAVWGVDLRVAAAMQANGSWDQPGAPQEVEA